MAETRSEPDAKSLAQQAIPTQRSIRVEAGEERLGARLDTLNSSGVAVLHDRRVPGTRANIDHITITPTGVWVIDAKRYRGRPQLRAGIGLPRTPTERLFVAGRDCSKLLDGLDRQIERVTAALPLGVPVTGALCFLDADWPLVGGSFVVRGTHVLWPRRLTDLLSAAPKGPIDVAAINARLAEAFQIA